MWITSSKLWTVYLIHYLWNFYPPCLRDMPRWFSTPKPNQPWCFFFHRMFFHLSPIRHFLHENWAQGIGSRNYTGTHLKCWGLLTQMVKICVNGMVRSTIHQFFIISCLIPGCGELGAFPRMHWARGRGHPGWDVSLLQGAHPDTNF